MLENKNNALSIVYFYGTGTKRDLATNFHLSIARKKVLRRGKW
jgi:hypothetical protein